ncbi:unnamed protein product [Protopolystoma xenopodis]|uniref:Uncharacterized protein n=1 Tax=Protopolystoma xenopodis TaxID=117903 RepID=A0A448XK83_9PLAT|nr:unnamed protein product [Protopolystoma xenopodis]
MSAMLPITLLSVAPSFGSNHIILSCPSVKRSHSLGSDRESSSFDESQLGRFDAKPIGRWENRTPERLVIHRATLPNLTFQFSGKGDRNFEYDHVPDDNQPSENDGFTEENRSFGIFRSVTPLPNLANLLSLPHMNWPRRHSDALMTKIDLADRANIPSSKHRISVRSDDILKRLPQFLSVADLTKGSP